MFTGIIESVGHIIAKTATELTMEKPEDFADLKIGASISVSGACLSVTAFDDRTMTFQVVFETWEKTNLGSLAAGSSVNLERAMPAFGRFEGHMVQGHVEAAGEVVSLEEQKRQGAVLSFRIPAALFPYIVSKGSIALNGVSLTVASIKAEICTVALIPLTLARTNLGQLKKGDLVNIETDMINRAVVHYLSTKQL